MKDEYIAMIWIVIYFVIGFFIYFAFPKDETCECDKAKVILQGLLEKGVVRHNSKTGELQIKEGIDLDNSCPGQVGNRE